MTFLMKDFLPLPKQELGDTVINWKKQDVKHIITDQNNLPYDVVTTKPLNSFKKRTDKLWNSDNMLLSNFI